MRQASLRADLGPTNTGKTHRAIMRMLHFNSGIMGLPLRLLAREVYDRVCAQISPEHVALITGEERIESPKAKYWICTVEAMPIEKVAEVVIIDEIQLCADLERGHTFTDRLLNARGTKETVFLGSHAMRPMLRKLFSDIEIETSDRLSKLSWIGHKKLSNLPPRSAVVAFSAEHVYATAEFLRRQHGGAAVVMGMLSPRTRNAQVELYQSGQVDYIVATDAIGLGLNLDIKNVFFAGVDKFDGRKVRSLFPHEIAQIAGRAGRFQTDGHFGTTANCDRFEQATIDAVEAHQFAAIKKIEWRNSQLDFRSLSTLISSLEKRTSSDLFNRARESHDLRALRHMANQLNGDNELSSKEVELLWSVCGLPDFPKFASGEHLALVERIFRDLRSISKRINVEYVRSQVEQLARPHHNIEILARKLSQIRTWTYIAQRKNWLNDAEAWRKRTRIVEDQISDALHESLMQSFVDARTSKLRKRLREKEKLMAEVTENGEVSIDGNFIGRLIGFQFEIDPKAEGEEAKTIRNAAQAALAPIYHLRSEKFYLSSDKDIVLSEQNGILWQGNLIGALAKGASVFKPDVKIFADENIAPEIREKIKRRLDHWVERRIAELFEPLQKISDNENLTGLVKGVGFQIVEALGVIPRETIASDIKSLTQDERALLRKYGVRFGQYTIFIPVLLKPAPTQFRIRLLEIWNGESESITPPPAGLVTVPKQENYTPQHYARTGYKLVGERAIRVDMLERLADLIRLQDTKNGFETQLDMLSITGLSNDQFANLMENIGFAVEKGEREKTKVNTQTEESSQEDAPTSEEPTSETFYVFKSAPRKKHTSKPKDITKNNRKSHSKPKHNHKKVKPIDPDNPFAALMALKK